MLVVGTFNLSTKKSWTGADFLNMNFQMGPLTSHMGALGFDVDGSERSQNKKGP